MATLKLIRNATIINEGKEFTGHVLIKDEIISDIFHDSKPVNIENCEVIDAGGNVLIPGVIDDQVHFREPGLTHKGSIKTESRAAVAGGITSFMEMPNTNPQTITNELLELKYQIGSKNSFANFSFYLGGTNDNLEELLHIDQRNVCGIKLFLGASTGNMLVDNPVTLENIFSKSKALIAVHCEQEPTIQKNIETYKSKYGENIPIRYHPLIRSHEACYKSSSFAVNLARKYGTRLHILHLSTEKELDLFDATLPLHAKQITAEVCVHHLWFSEEDYDFLGNLIKWNPAIKSKKDRDALFRGLLENKIDIVATDHAPHTLEEKRNPYLKAPSGGPLVQHSLQVMIEFFHQKKISLERIVEKMCHTPAEMFKINRRGFIRKGYFADLVILDLTKKQLVEKDNIFYKCNWSPFENYTFSSSVTHTFVNGELVFDNGKFNEKVRGHRLTFNR